MDILKAFLIGIGSVIVTVVLILLAVLLNAIPVAALVLAIWWLLALFTAIPSPFALAAATLLTAGNTLVC